MMNLKQNLGLLRFQKNGIIFQQKNHTSVDLLVFEYEYLIHLILS